MGLPYGMLGHDGSTSPTGNQFDQIAASVAPPRAITFAFGKASRTWSGSVTGIQSPLSITSLRLGDGGAWSKNGVNCCSAAGAESHTVIDSVRDWVAGLLIALSTLFLTVGGVRYITAQGDPRSVEEAKAGIKAALIGYALAALAPTLVSILQKVLRT